MKKQKLAQRILYIIIIMITTRAPFCEIDPANILILRLCLQLE